MAQGADPTPGCPVQAGAEGATQNHRDTIRYLLGQGALIDCRDGYGETALITAAREGRPKTVALLLEWGANADAVDHTGKDARAHTMERAAHYGNHPRWKDSFALLQKALPK